MLGQSTIDLSCSVGPKTCLPQKFTSNESVNPINSYASYNLISSNHICFTWCEVDMFSFLQGGQVRAHSVLSLEEQVFISLVTFASSTMHFFVMHKNYYTFVYISSHWDQSSQGCNVVHRIMITKYYRNKILKFWDQGSTFQAHSLGSWWIPCNMSRTCFLGHAECTQTFDQRIHY